MVGATQDSEESCSSSQFSSKSRRSTRFAIEALSSHVNGFEILAVANACAIVCTCSCAMPP